MLIFNQNLLDLVSCLFLGVQYSLVLGNIYLSGVGGYLLCITILSSAGTWGAYIGSLINLAAISIERYLKIVHHVWAKNKFRNWMIYSTIAFSWISGIVCAASVTIPTTAVVNGVCRFRVFFKSKAAQTVYGIWSFLSFYVIILFILIFCYGRILITIRRQATVMAACSGQESSHAQDQSNKIQTSIIKTMILVSGLFAITWTPGYIRSLLKHLHFKLKIVTNGLYAMLFIGYLYMCINPFIYATKFDPVKRILLGLIPCKKNTQNT